VFEFCVDDFCYDEQAESLGNEGKVEEAQIKTGKCDQLRTERLKLQEVSVSYYY